MNITDVKETLGEEGDKLDLIFKFQSKLKEKYDLIEKDKGLCVPDLPLNINDCKTQVYLKDLFYRVVTELVEASETLKSKPWKMSEVLVDRDHLFEELSDATHFLVELCICLGMDSEVFFQNYFKKMKVNEWRIKTNY